VKQASGGDVGQRLERTGGCGTERLGWYRRKPRAVAHNGQRGAERWGKAVECNRLYRSGFKES